MLFQRSKWLALLAVVLSIHSISAWSEDTPSPAAPPTEATPAEAQPAAAPAEKISNEVSTAPAIFDINDFQVEGNTLLPEATIKNLVKPYTGKSRDFGAVQQALETLQAEYQRIGHGSVQVLLPEQEMKQGIVLLQVVEQPIGKISVTGNQHFSDTNILASLPHLQKGELPNTKKIARDLALANENPVKRTSMLFKSSETGGEGLEATVKVTDDKPWKVFLTADNTGDRQTSFGRVGIGYQNYNVGDRDQRLTLQFTTDMHWPNGDEHLLDPDVKIFGVGYTIPFYQWGDSLDLLAGYANTNSGVVQGLFNVTGSGLIEAVHYNHNFDKIGNYTHKLTGGLDYHAYRPDVAPNGTATSVVPHQTVTPFVLSYSGQWAGTEQSFSYSLAGAWNIPSAAHGSAADLALTDAQDDYSKYNFAADYYRPLPFTKNWQLHVGVDGQLTGDHLITGEQYGVGGMYTVRGWHERSVIGDKGYRYTAEAISPDYGAIIGEKVGLHWVLFTDKAHVNNNRGVVTGAVPLESSKSIQSVGAGLRFGYAQRFVGRMDTAVVVDGDTAPVTGGSRKGGDIYTNVSVAWIW